ncbi:MAG: Rrf2 family transcriptional regulator [Patescibacteria group bacterium]
MKSIKSIDYGMVLLTSLMPTYGSGDYFNVRTIARSYKLPAPFLEKLAQRFKRAGILESRRGIGGGYCLVKNPNSISIETVISVLDNKYQYCPINHHLVTKSLSK